MSNPKRLSDYIEHDMDAAHVEHLWKSIEKNQPRPAAAARRSNLYWGLAALAAGVSLGWFFGAPSQKPPTVTAKSTPAETPVEPLQAVSNASATHEPTGSQWESTADTLSFHLADEARVQLLPRSKLVLRESDSLGVTLELKEGQATFGATEAEKKRLTIHAGPVVVRAIGTSFLVARSLIGEKEEIRVSVQQGSAEVRGPDGDFKRLATGESWSVQLASVKSHETSGDDPTRVAKDSSENPRHSRAAPTIDDQARTLFDSARAEKNNGRPAVAAALYQQFLTQYPSHSRIGLAALELGRLKLDQLGDAQGAIAPLQRALRNGAGGLGDDTLARLAQAQAQAGQTAACHESRKRYLQKYPKGVHLKQIRTLCP